MEKTNWRIVGIGLGVIGLSAVLIMFLPLDGRRIVGIIILFIIGLALCVAGSPDTRNSSGGNRKAH